METKEIALPEESKIIARPDTYAQTPAQFKQALDEESEKRHLLLDYVRKELIPGVDYGLVHRKIKVGYKQWDPCPHESAQVLNDKLGNIIPCPTCGAKYSLWKPGAEKICSLLHVVPTFSIDSEMLDGLGLKGRAVAFRCHLVSLHTGVILGEGRGAADIAVDQAGNPVKPLNTTIKMGQKSAQIDATIRLSGMSGVFTQDIEDMTPEQLEKYKGEKAAAQAAKGEKLKDELCARFDAGAKPSTVADVAPASAEAEGGGVGSQSVESGEQAPFAGEQFSPPARTAEPVCPKCSGPCWDNRADRAEAEAAIKAGTRKRKAPPAWKCRDKECGGVIWPAEPEKPEQSGAVETAEATDAASAQPSAAPEPPTPHITAADLPISQDQADALTAIFRKCALTRGNVRKLLNARFRVGELTALTEAQAAILLADYKTDEPDTAEIDKLREEIDAYLFDEKISVDFLTLHCQKLGYSGDWHAAPGNYIRTIHEAAQKFIVNSNQEKD